MGAAVGTPPMAGDTASRLTAGLRAPLFLAMWTVMMVAMMFPAAAPMILSFAHTESSKRRHGQVFVPTWIFVLGYLLVWAAARAAAFLLASGAGRLADSSMVLADNAGRLAGVVLVLAGLYQFTPLKSACLTKCRTPLQFILTSWRDGRLGALRMGLSRRLFCLGCCWLFFLILFPLGIMNLAAMAVITLLVVAHPAALLTTL